MQLGINYETGADMKYVQQRLGHSSIQITSDVYAHISKMINMKSI
jgi:integrase